MLCFKQISMGYIDKIRAASDRHNWKTNVIHTPVYIGI